jgi:hypothetical protein
MKRIRGSLVERRVGGKKRIFRKTITADRIETKFATRFRSSNGSNTSETVLLMKRVTIE